MKKWLSAMSAAVLLLCLASCGPNAEQTTENTKTGVPAQTAAGTSNTGTPNPMDDYVPVMLYDAETHANVCRYVDRTKFIAYLDAHKPEGFIEYRSLLDEIGSVIDANYDLAYRFDENSRAIVAEAGAHGMSFNLIDEKGAPILSTDSYRRIVPADGRYVSFSGEGDSADYDCTLLDADGSVLAAARNVGLGYYRDGKIHTDSGRILDAATLTAHEPAHEPELYYDWIRPLGGGYSAVADFWNLGEDFDSEFERAYLTENEYVFRKAIFRGGRPLTDQKFYVIEPVLPFGCDLFYVSDENSSFILNVSSCERMEEFSLSGCGSSWHFTEFPGLLIGENASNRAYITPESSVYISRVHSADRLSFYESSVQDKTFSRSYPVLLLGDRKVSDAINGAIADVFEADSPCRAVIAENGIYMENQSTSSDLRRRGNVLTVAKNEYSYYAGAAHPMMSASYYNFDLRTGGRIGAQDWFRDPDAAGRILLDAAQKQFSALGIEQSTGDRSEDFRTDEWSEKIYIDPGMMVIHYDAGSAGWNFPVRVEVPLDEIADLLKDEYRSAFE